jgi:hypothetical protein
LHELQEQKQIPAATAAHRTVVTVRSVAEPHTHTPGDARQGEGWGCTRTYWSTRGSVPPAVNMSLNLLITDAARATLAAASASAQPHPKPTPLHGNRSFQTTRSLPSYATLPLFNKNPVRSGQRLKAPDVTVRSRHNHQPFNNADGGEPSRSIGTDSTWALLHQVAASRDLAGHEGLGARTVLAGMKRRGLHRRMRVRVDGDGLPRVLVRDVLQRLRRRQRLAVLVVPIEPHPRRLCVCVCVCV